MNMPTKPAPKQSKFFFLFGFFWAILSLPFILVGYSFLQDEIRYEKESVVTTGTLLSKNTTQSTDSDGHTSTHYVANYEFKDLQGETIQGESNIERDRWNELIINQPVEIQYVKGSTSKNRIKQEPSYVLSYIFCGIGGFAFLLGVVFMTIYIRKNLKFKRINNSGILASATVTSVRPGNLEINGVRQWVIHYSYQDYQGKQQKGETGYLSPDDANAWKSGDKGQIKFDSSNSAESIWLGSAI